MTSQRVKDATDTAGEWRPIKGAPKNRRVLVTNNINSRDAHGGMSHVWISFVHKPSYRGDPDGYCGFSNDYNKIRGLTHYCDIPAPAAPSDNKPERSVADETGEMI